MQNASFSGKTLELGQGQSIQFGDDSDLSIEGTPDNFTIRGLARLGSTKLGGDSLGLALEGGNAQVEVKVSRDANGDARFDLTLSELEGNALALNATVGGLASRLDVHSVQDASVKVSYAPGVDPVFEVDLPAVSADIVSDGALRSGDRGGDLNLQGSVQGNLAFAMERSAVRSRIFDSMRWPVVPWLLGRSDLKVQLPSWNSQDEGRFVPTRKARSTFARRRALNR